MKISRLRAGFSLIEILVVMGIIGLLLAVSLPALGRVRGASRSVVSSANLRSLGQIITLYTGQYGDAHPISAEDEFYEFGDIKVSFGRLLMPSQWPIVLHGVAPWQQNIDVFHSPGVRRRLDDDTQGFPSSYTYSLAYILRPEVLGGTIPPDADPIAATRVNDVHFPSQKTILWEWELPYLNRSLKQSGVDLAEETPILFSDGHVVKRRPSDATAPAPNSLLTNRVGSQRLHNTPGGVRGRDF